MIAILERIYPFVLVLSLVNLNLINFKTIDFRVVLNIHVNQPKENMINGKVTQKFARRTVTRFLGKNLRVLRRERVSILSLKGRKEEKIQQNLPMKRIKIDSNNKYTLC